MDEVNIGEEVLERTIHPDGTVVERVIRRGASARIEGNSPTIQSDPPPQRPIPPLGRYWRTQYVTESSPEIALAQASRVLDKIAGGLNSANPWSMVGSGVQGQAQWCRWLTYAHPKGFGIHVDLIVSPPEDRCRIVLRVSIAPASKFAEWNYESAARAGVKIITDQLGESLAGTLPELAAIANAIE
jgi:hypothetical protein